MMKEITHNNFKIRTYEVGSSYISQIVFNEIVIVGFQQAVESEAIRYATSFIDQGLVIDVLLNNAWATKFKI